MLRIVKAVFLVVALAALAWFAWQSRTLLHDVLQSARPLRLALATIIWLLMNAAAAAFTVCAFQSIGTQISFTRAMTVHVRNLPARYIPGGIWHTVGRVAGFRELGIGARPLSVFVLLENVLAAGVAFLLGAALLVATQAGGRLTTVILAAGLGAFAVLLLLPYLLSRFAGPGSGKPDAASLVRLALLTAMSWSIAATAFVAYVSAFPELSENLAPLNVAGGYLFSWAAGFVAVFAPQGIGVFEVVAAELLRGSAPLIGVAALLAGFRIVILVADTVAWLVLQAASGLAVGQRRNLLRNEPDQENDHRGTQDE